MTDFTSDDDEMRRLAQLSEEVTRIAAALARLSMGLTNAPVRHDIAKTAGTDESPAPVDQILHARRARARYLLGELFAEPAWDIFLGLFSCELKGRRLSTSDLCLAAGVPGTTALRWIKALVQRGCVIREPDGQDGHRVFIAPGASAVLRRFFSEVIERK